MPSTKHITDPSDIVFLLGAGASVDAGLPDVSGLSRELWASLPHMRDVNGQPCPGIQDVFNKVAGVDPEVKVNYERFFEWTRLLLDASKKPFRELIRVDIAEGLTDLLASFAWGVKDEIVRLMTSRPTKPEYLARIGDFIPARRRLQVFTLNFDSCLEDACQRAGIDLTTGFDPTTKKWNPKVLASTARGINLYKLHGSLRWYRIRNESLPVNNFQHRLRLVELKPGDRDRLPPHLSVSQEPDLVLGPGTKLQADDPFITLTYEFHRILHRARVCVIVGYAYRDPHVQTILEEALDRGLRILEVNPRTTMEPYDNLTRYRHLRLRTKEALDSGRLADELRNLSKGI